jgi:hypothetical protein
MIIDPVLAGKIVAILVATGTLISVFQAVIQQPWFPSKAKAWITVILSAMSAGIAYIVQNGLTWNDWPSLITWLAGFFGTTVLLYHGLYKHLPIMAKIESVGSLKSAAPDALVDADLIDAEPVDEVLDEDDDTYLPGVPFDDGRDPALQDQDSRITPPEGL